MLVEDDKSLREIYGVRLLAEGYDIISAGDGEEALAMAIKERPQLIISDVMMPKISGFDMLDILRSTTETKNIRVVMMTALSSDEQRERGEQLGADKYLVKSQVGIEDVVKAVHEVLGDTPGAANAPNPTGGTPPLPATPAPTPTIQAAPVGPTTTIPEPTAPFTGERPANLGERVIQPLPDNPRISKVDIHDLVNKEMAASVQAVENSASEDTLPVTPAPIPAPAQVDAPVSISPPTPVQPAADDPTALASLTAQQLQPVPTPPATPVTASPIIDPSLQVPSPAAQVNPAAPTANPIVATPLQYEESQVVTPAAPVEAQNRADVPLTPPDRPLGV